MNICFICDENYVLLTKTAINSLVKTQKEKLRIYIIAVDLSDTSVAQFSQFLSKNVEIIILRQKNIYKDMNFKHPYITSAVYFKFIIADLLKEDKVLYLDGDIIATDDIADFYNITLGNHYAAIVPDLVVEKEDIETKKTNPNLYFNCGIMLLNLKKIRQDKLLVKLNEHRLKNPSTKYAEQDIFNAVCQDNVIYADYRWNYFNVYEWKDYAELSESRNKNLIHYAGHKPLDNVFYPLTELWLKYVLPEDLGIVLKTIFTKFDKQVQNCLTGQENEFEKIKQSVGDLQKKTDKLNNLYQILAKLNVQNMLLLQKIEHLEKRPRFVWRLYEFIKSNRKKKLYILGIPIIKIKRNIRRTIKKIYLFGIPIWIHHKKKNNSHKT